MRGDEGRGRRSEEPLRLEVAPRTEVAALFYSLLESAKLAGVDPAAYLRVAAVAGLHSERIPLPHELATAAD